MPEVATYKYKVLIKLSRTRQGKSKIWSSNSTLSLIACRIKSTICSKAKKFSSSTPTKTTCAKFSRVSRSINSKFKKITKR